MGRRISGNAAGASPDVYQVLTDGATINWNMTSGNIAAVTIAGNRAFANPTNLKVGGVALEIIQDGSGNRTITSWGSVFKWPEGVVPVLSTAGGKKDVISGVCDGTSIYVSYIRGVA
jgi:hypothetical protein